MRGRRIDVLIAYAIDRLSRDPVHLGVILSEADHAGVRVEFVTEPLDDSPEGQLIRFVRGYAAKVEHLKIVDRIRRGKWGRVTSGKPLAGKKPLCGYRWADHAKTRLEVNPAEAQIVRRIFEMAASGVSLRRIAFALTEEQIPSPTGLGRWARITISHMVRNLAYTGRAFAYKTQATKPRGGKHYIGKPRPIEEWRPLPEGTVPAMVDDETWAGIQSILATNRQRAARNCKHPEDYLLRGGFAVCGSCGSPLNTSRPNGIPAYRCGRANRDRSCAKGGSMYALLLDEIVWSRVESVLRNSEIVAAEVAHLQQHDPTNGDLAIVDAALADVSRRQRNLARSLAALDDPNAGAPLLVELSGLRELQERLEGDRAAILERRKALDASHARLGEIEAWCRRVGQRLDSLTYEQRRLALQALGVQITVYQKDAPERWILTASIPVDGGEIVERSSPESCADRSGR